MGKSVSVAAIMKIFCRIFSIILLINHIYTEPRKGKQFSLFNIVQFPNDECTSSSSSTTTGTCITTSECTNAGGSGSGSCAAGFGVCCVITSTTCGDTLSANITYIRNPGYPSTYTPTTTVTCSFTIDKLSDDICQLRLDFQTMSGYTPGTTVGECTTNSLEVTGNSGQNPPKICGTNTDFHMYVEFGASATDSITLKHTLDTTSKSWNILARQIACTASWKAPTDCVQYFTGTSGNVKNYNFGTQLLQSQNYNNCIRQETGYCRIQWQQNSASSPDTFQMDTVVGTALPTAAGGISGAPAITTTCPLAFVKIPNGSLDGVTPLDTGLSGLAFQSVFCGGVLGVSGSPTSNSIVSAKPPFHLAVWSAAAATNT